MKPYLVSGVRFAALAVVAALGGLVACSGDDGAASRDTVEVTFAVTVPGDTPENEPVSVVGDWQGWNHDDPTAALIRRERDYRITLPFPVGEPVTFKFSRGDWLKIESDADGFVIEPREWTPAVEDHGETLTFTVAEWTDRALRGANDAVRRLTRSGRVELWKPAGWPDRRVWTYLPPGYAQSDERYPVLYMLDGQNVFDRVTAYAGEWGVDETCEQLIAEGAVRPVIVVAVDNGGIHRIAEYTPVDDPSFMGGIGGEGDDHLAQLVAHVMPEVARRYRTLSGPENTGFAGSSLGGLMALYAAFERPDLFGRIGAFSPSIWWADRWIIDFIESKAKPAGRLYVDMGHMEASRAIPDLNALVDALEARGFAEDTDLFVVREDAGRHDEGSWRRRFPGALERLFGAP